MSKISNQFKLAVGAAALFAMLCSAQPKPEQPVQHVYDVQSYLNIDDVDAKKLDYTSINQNLDALFFVHFPDDDKDVHVVVDTVDYSMLTDTVIELHIADDTLVTRELEAQINHEITEYFDDKRQDWLRQEARDAEEAHAEYQYENVMYWAGR